MAHSTDGYLAGKNAFITGAGANIGRAIALEMAAAGANIYFADKDAASSAALERELTRSGAKVQGFVCDTSQIPALESIVARLKQQGVTINILVNNVGITIKEPETTPESFERWQKAMDTNVLAPLYLSRLVAQTMIEKRIAGSILFITSIHQWITFGDEVYSATKASLGLIIDELAVSLAPHEIRVNGIAPGNCREAADGSPLPHDGTPLRQESVLPHYIGRAAVFLSSDYFSGSTTGATLKIDGGLSLYTYLSRRLISPALPKSRGLFSRLRPKLGKVRRLARSLFP